MQSLGELIESAGNRFATQPAFTCLGKTISFQDLSSKSHALAQWLLSLQLPPDTRVGVMMPNILQNPIAIAGVLRAGMVVVNINPLYTARELAQQLNDSGASVVIVLANFAHTLEQAEHRYGLPALQRVVITELGDELGAKRWLVNAVVRYVKRMVPRWRFPSAWTVTRWRAVVPAGPASAGAGASTAAQASPPALPPLPSRTRNDLAFLQYTGGTTGTSKGAMLTHGNVLANLDQCESWLEPHRLKEQLALHRGEPATLTMLCALPLYHIFSLTACMMLGLKSGFRNLLLPNPRDFKSTLDTLSHERVHLFPGVNTLFNALLNQPDIRRADFSELMITVGGGMAVTASVAERWKSLTGCLMLEGYGLSETSPVVAATPRQLDRFTASVGLAMPGTEIKLINDHGQPVNGAETGEIAVRGPQVMLGYWNAPQETAQAFTPDGYFKTGDIGFFDAHGFLHILDRKKDMILVSGFNVYPNEVEQVVSQLPGVAECAAIGVPDESCGEVVKLFVVPRNPALTEAEILAHCAQNLTNYKRPRRVEFKTELPKSAVGKVLRRALRDSTQALI